MTMLTAREVARRYNSMMRALVDGDAAGDTFEAWIDRYRVSHPFTRPQETPIAVSDAREGPRTVEWWQHGDQVVGIRQWDNSYFSIPLSDLRVMPSSGRGFAID